METKVQIQPDYRVQEIAHIMGVCGDTARRLVRQGIVPGAYRAGGEWRIIREAFDAWRESGGSR